MKNKLSVLNLSLVALCLISTLACGFLNRSGSNLSNLSANNANSNQKSEQVSVPKGVKPSEPCGWFEKSLEMKAGEYKPHDTKPGVYDCYQLKHFSSYDSSSFSYLAKGSAEDINEFTLAMTVVGRLKAKQKENLHEILGIAAMEVADRASGNKLSDDILRTILSGEDKDFTLEPSADSTKPQLKTLSVLRSPSKLGTGYSMYVTLKF